MRVALFTPGGTIASTSAPGPARPAESFAAADGGVTPCLAGADLLAAVPGLDAGPALLDPPASGPQLPGGEGTRPPERDRRFATFAGYCVVTLRIFLLTGTRSAA
jgi:hypothetical protein